MFRKNYKDAIDDIETNKELLNSLLIKATSASIPEKRRKPRIYAWGTVAAAAAIAIISIHSSSNTEILKNSENNQVAGELKETKTEIRNEALSTEILDLKNPGEELNQDTVQKKKSVTAEKTPVQEVLQAEENQKQQETQIAANAAPTESESAPLEEPQNEPAIMAVNEAAVGTTETAEETEPKAKAYSGGGGGSSARAIAETAIETEIRTSEEYGEYLGINVEKTAVIPEDMKKTSSDTVYISKDKASGEIVNDYHSFTYTGENGRYISVTTTKETENFGKSESKKNGEYETFTFKNGEVGFRIECYKLTEEEKNILINSLKES